jgi:phosphatidylserine/phosphatidylglycerophosphate/cardiolipin synthase-like enzyme
MPRRCGVQPFIALVALFAASAAVADTTAGRHFAATGTIEVAFAPGDRIDRLIIGEIDQSRHDVAVLAYSFTDRTIARALIRARQRGVQVQVVADREQARALPQNVLKDLVAGGVDVWLDGNFQSAHNKVIVIDADAPRATTITGSYNFTIAAQRANAENVIVLRDNPPVARAHRDNWAQRRTGATRWADAARQ